jgi:DNA-binding CsgD family transcriptional regulator
MEKGLGIPAPRKREDDGLAGPARGAGLARLGYLGPERRRHDTDMARWLRRTLDEVDYGMLLLDAGGGLLHANQAARAELDAEHPLHLDGRRLSARQLADASALSRALDGARRGRRKLLTLGPAGREACLCVVPLGESVTLLLLGKRQVSEQLSVQAYAKGVGLTPAETRVLEALCAGVRPGEIAERQGVAVSTVRTQIGSIRAKVGVSSIRELVRRVAVLPPLVPARGTSAGHAAG